MGRRRLPASRWNSAASRRKSLEAVEVFLRPFGILRRSIGEFCGPPKIFGGPLEFSSMPPEKSGGRRSFPEALWNSPTLHWRILWAAEDSRWAVGILQRAAGKVWRPSKFCRGPLEFSNAPLENSVGRQKFPARRWNSAACRWKSLEAVEIFREALEFSGEPLEFRGTATKFCTPRPKRRTPSRFHGTAALRCPTARMTKPREGRRHRAWSQSAGGAATPGRQPQFFPEPKRGDRRRGRGARALQALFPEPSRKPAAYPSGIEPRSILPSPAKLRILRALAQNQRVLISTRAYPIPSSGSCPVLPIVGIQTR